MSFQPDPDELRALADRIDDHATAARASAARLAHVAGGTDWEGPAAVAARTGIDIVLVALHTTAGRLGSAADSLRRHAGVVGHREHEIRAMRDEIVHLAADLASAPCEIAHDLVGSNGLFDVPVGAAIERNVPR